MRKLVEAESHRAVFTGEDGAKSADASDVLARAAETRAELVRKVRELEEQISTIDAAIAGVSKTPGVSLPGSDYRGYLVDLARNDPNPSVRGRAFDALIALDAGRAA